MKITYTLCCGLALVCSTGALPGLAAEDSVVALQFETSSENWKARAPSVRVECVQAPGAQAESRGCLRVAGSIEKGWNYAVSPHYKVVPGQRYRLSCWLRVDQLGAGTPAPYLKCEFVGADVQRYLGQMHTDHYDVTKMGAWQELVQEFQAPQQAQEVWFALEKGTEDPTRIEALIDNLQLRTIERFSVLEQYRFKALPGAMERARGVHPRLFLNAERLASLRSAINSTHQHLWDEVRETADAAVRRGPPKYRADPDRSGSEQLWQRSVGNAMPSLAIAYVVTGDEKYLSSAQQWALAACSYPTWGLDRYDGMDLAAGHQLLGLAIIYDWCYDDLPSATREKIRDTLIRRGGAMFEAAATGKVGWHRAYLQNHLWVNVCGLAAAGLAVFDEVEDAQLWVGLALDKFQRTSAALGNDGASHEGVGYWEYGVEYLLKFMELARDNLDVDLYDHAWWRQTAAYPLYLSLPRDAWQRGNCIVDLADCPRGHWYGPDYLLRRLASEFRDPYAQWLAEQTDEAGVASPEAIWLNLLWYDPTVKPTPPTDLPTLRHFEDLGIVTARSDWSGSESLVVFKCGPHLGHEALQKFSYDPGGGHVHPDTNHFVVFAGGQWLIRDDGYRAKWTGQHNTLLIDGQGQLGEGHKWFQGAQLLAAGAQPKILRARSTSSGDLMVGDATQSYSHQLGLQKFQRHLIFLKPDVLIVVDDIQVDQPRDLELRFFPESKEMVPLEGAQLVRGDKATLRLQSLTPQSAQILTGDVAVEGREGSADAAMFAVRIRHHGTDWRHATALSWCAAQQQPVPVTLKVEGQRWTFRAGERTAVLDWSFPIQ